MSESILWYATRGAGFVSLIMLTGVVCLGILTSVRWQRPGWPRFLTVQLHQSVSLLSLVFLAIHILVAVVDPYTSLGLAALVPFASRYRTIWLGLGAVALYLVIAITGTSLTRNSLGHRAWRVVHWLTYAAWPIALVHGIGTGSDAGAVWSWLLDGACVAAALGATAWRIGYARSAQAERERALPALERR
ncbi:MAG: ferric reductase [Chloroflexi bacterium]|nr:MAG: ferric reductase [Chloroflexota bacterium]